MRGMVDINLYYDEAEGLAELLEAQTQDVGFRLLAQDIRAQLPDEEES